MSYFNIYFLLIYFCTYFALGNYLRAEILYRAEVNPFSSLRAIWSDPEEKSRFCNAIRTVIAEVVDGNMNKYGSPEQVQRFNQWLKCYVSPGSKTIDMPKKRTFYYNPIYSPGSAGKQPKAVASPFCFAPGNEYEKLKKAKPKMKSAKISRKAMPVKKKPVAKIAAKKMPTKKVPAKKKAARKVYSDFSESEESDIDLEEESSATEEEEEDDDDDEEERTFSFNKTKKYAMPTKTKKTPAKKKSSMKKKAVTSHFSQGGAGAIVGRGTVIQPPVRYRSQTKLFLLIHFLERTHRISSVEKTAMKTAILRATHSSHTFGYAMTNMTSSIYLPRFDLSTLFCDNPQTFFFFFPLMFLSWLELR